MKRALLAALCAALLVPATADAAAKRVVAIEWDTVENLHMLGMAPVGAADMKGYDTWVAAPRPRGMKDVGSRQSPSIERIAALKPDLIVVPDYRSTKNLVAAQEDRAPCSSRTRTRRAARSSPRWSPTSGGSPTRSAAAVARRARPAGPLATTSRATRRALKRGGRAGAAVAIATPGGTTQRARDPHVHDQLADRRRRAPARPARRLERAPPATASRRSASRASRA